MILNLSCRSYGIGLKLPATSAEVDEALSKLREGLESAAAPIRISGVLGDVYNLSKYIQYANPASADDLPMLNQLAGMVDRMSTREQRILAGALDSESINGLGDVVRVAVNLGQYECIEGVTTDKELGGWLVEHRAPGLNFPTEVRPYLDYAAIGAEYYANRGGAYTPHGYVKRRENAQIQAVENKPAFSLTLASSGCEAYRLGLPATDSELEQAKSALKLGDFACAMIDEIDIGYSWAHLLPKEGFTVEDASTLAQYVTTMSKTELRTFGAALEAEEPDTFPDAVAIAVDLEDYELVDDNEASYGYAVLRKAGANDEVLELLEGCLDFEKLGRMQMDADGLRTTSYGMVRCPSTNGHRQEPDYGPEMGGF